MVAAAPAVLYRRKLKFKQTLKAVHDIMVSSAETMSTVNTGFVNVNLHRPTTPQRRPAAARASLRFLSTAR
jgi:uncharacterized protein (DUF934 family)